MKREARVRYLLIVMTLCVVACDYPAGGISRPSNTPPVLAFVSAQVRGVVTDAASGEPVEGAEVSWDDGSLGPGDAPHLETAADGRYEFEVRTRPTSQPSVHVQARKNGYAAEDREVKFQANETVSADFQLRAVASASGPR